MGRNRNNNFVSRLSITNIDIILGQAVPNLPWQRAGRKWNPGKIVTAFFFYFLFFRCIHPPYWPRGTHCFFAISAEHREAEEEAVAWVDLGCSMDHRFFPRKKILVIKHIDGASPKQNTIANCKWNGCPMVRVYLLGFCLAESFSK